MAYVNPLLYQASDSASTTAANPKPLKAVVEPLQAKAKSRKRKGKGEKDLSESGDVTPMAGSSNQISDLNMLFAKLVQPPTSVAEASSEVRSSLASSKKRVPSFLETLMGSPEPTAIPATMTASHQPPVKEPKSMKITLEGLFASAINPTRDNSAYDPQKNQYKPDSYVWDHRQQSLPDVDNSMTLAKTQTRGDPLRHIVSTSENTGMALLNDIFASASATVLTSSTSIIAPSDPISFQNNVSSASNQSTPPLPTNASKHTDEPETIEIYSPRPKAPLSLASMFDAAVRDATPSPSTELGLGLSLDGIQENVMQGNQMMLTKQVLDTLLETGGSMDLDTQDYRSNGHLVAEADTSSYATAEVNGAEPEEIRRKLLDMIGLGTASLPHPPATNGDATPRVLLKNIPPLTSNSLPTSAGFLKQPTQPADVSFAETDYAFNEGDDDDEAIVELDFSDTRALSDLRAFENRERALREQLVERRAASRSASRSTTPAVLNHGPIPNKAKVNLKGPDVSGVDLKTEAHAFALNGENRYAPYALSPSTALPSTLPQITSSKVILHPVTPAEIPRKISAPIADTPVTPPVPTTIAQKTPTGSPSKKKTRRGRGRGKEKERQSKEGSPVPNMQSESISHAMGSVTSEDIDGQPDVETKGMAMEESSVPSSSSHNNDSLIYSEVSSQINTSLSFVLSEKDKYQVSNREELAELATRLLQVRRHFSISHFIIKTRLQTDRNFVDELWRAWKGSNEKFATISEGNISTVIASMTSPVEVCDANTENGDQKSESPYPTLPHIALTHSAPAKLPTLIDGSSSVLFDAVRPVSPQSDFQHTLSGLPSPAIINNGKVIEAERQGDPAIIEEENSLDTVDFGDADESHVVERLL
ncbi:hypothetical protein C8R41DRAFT_61256 [Lentinula lateritia]|uniref:Uncharacterized protein n=1 Tax=Lentinula lateritia TaxID=40482 RepID=A0ABQ8VV25_9AGAR|nr:hypothetical protein C8R41DRAFT_61256 [Lentinula lateritia]